MTKTFNPLFDKYKAELDAAACKVNETSDQFIMDRKSDHKLEVFLAAIRAEQKIYQKMFADNKKENT